MSKSSQVLVRRGATVSDHDIRGRIRAQLERRPAATDPDEMYEVDMYAPCIEAHTDTLVDAVVSVVDTELAALRAQLQAAERERDEAIEDRHVAEGTVPGIHEHHEGISLSNGYQRLARRAVQGEARTAELEALLRKYGYHAWECTRARRGHNPACTCGWSEVDAGLKRVND